MGRREKIILSIIVFLTLFVFGFFLYALLNNREETAVDQKTSSPTPTPASISTPEKDRVETQPLIEYEDGSAGRVREQVTNPQRLNASDFQVKQNIISQLNGSGVLYTSQNVRLEYISSADLFHGVILSQNISSAKEEARSYFTSRGMSNEGVCSLSLIFYIDRPLAEEISEEGVVFNPLLDAC